MTTEKIMNPGLKYTLARFGILLVCLIPAVFLFPTANLLLKLLVAFVVSAVASFFLLRGWRDEVAEQLSASATRRGGEKERLRAALSGEPDDDLAADVPEPRHAAPEDDEKS
jgi:hypothetical protein